MPLKSRQFEALISDRSRKTRSEVDQIMRRLREAGRLVAGPRGPHALPMTAEAAAQVLVTVCGAAAPGDAVAAWSAYHRPVSSSGERFLTVLSRALERGAHDIRHVLVWIDSVSAEIVWMDDRRDVFTKPGEAPPEQAFDSNAREIAFIGGGLLREIAEALQ